MTPCMTVLIMVTNSLMLGIGMLTAVLRGLRSNLALNPIAHEPQILRISQSPPLVLTEDIPLWGC